MRILLLIMGLLVAAVANAEVYRSMDESGNIIYSDKPSPDAEEIHIDPIQTIEAPDIEPFEYTPPAQPAASIYTGLAITSPEEGATIRSNEGEVSINATVAPGLNISAGHQLVLIMDGNEVSAGGPQFDLQNIDRGTHSVSVVIKDKEGKTVMQSEPVTFNLHRVSVKKATPKPAPPKPAPPKPPAPAPAPP